MVYVSGGSSSSSGKSSIFSANNFLDGAGGFLAGDQTADDGGRSDSGRWSGTRG